MASTCMPSRMSTCVAVATDGLLRLSETLVAIYPGATPKATPGPLKAVGALDQLLPPRRRHHACDDGARRAHSGQPPRRHQADRRHVPGLRKAPARRRQVQGRHADSNALLAAVNRGQRDSLKARPRTRPSACSGVTAELRLRPTTRAKYQGVRRGRDDLLRGFWSHRGASTLARRATGSARRRHRHHRPSRLRRCWPVRITLALDEPTTTTILMPMRWDLPAVAAEPVRKQARKGR